MPWDGPVEPRPFGSRVSVKPNSAAAEPGPGRGAAMRLHGDPKLDRHAPRGDVVYVNLAPVDHLVKTNVSHPDHCFLLRTNNRPEDIGQVRLPDRADSGDVRSQGGRPHGGSGGDTVRGGWSNSHRSPPPRANSTTAKRSNLRATTATECTDSRPREVMPGPPPPSDPVSADPVTAKGHDGTARTAR